MPRQITSPYERLVRGAVEGPTIRAELGPCLDYRSVLSTDRHPMVICGSRPNQVWISGARLVLEHGLGRPLVVGLLALHHCDRPRCIRFSHLYEGTQQENVRDRDQRTGNPLRQYDKIGESHHLAKITDGEVHQIRFLVKMGCKVAAVALLFPHVSRALVYGIVSGKRWTHV